MTQSIKTTLLACTAAAVLGGFALAYAADAPPPAVSKPAAPARMEHPAPTREMREQMASLHEHMAACLRSAKSVEDCHHEMMAAHEKMEGAMGEKHEHDCEHMMKMHKHMEHAEAGEHDHEHDTTK
jgi:hypothetical protein